MTVLYEALPNAPIPEKPHVGLIGLESTVSNKKVWLSAMSSQTKANTELKRPSFPTIAFRRLAFGARTGDLGAFRALADKEPACLQNYVELQLHPERIDDQDCKQLLAQHPHWNMYRQSAWQLWQEHASQTADWAKHMEPLEATEQLTLLRAIHSNRQLLEKTVTFWRQHFHIYGRAYGVAPLIPDYDLMVLRTHTFGNFRNMLQALATSPAVLNSFENDQNRVRNIQEHWARTLLSKFTLGERNDFGTISPNQVPTDIGGRPIGYTNEDVRAVARCFTGWTSRDGRFLYRHDRHDAGGKWIMDLYLPPGQGHRKDGEMLLDWLAVHPATAHHVCQKLCHYFLGKTSKKFVSSAAEVFLKHQDSPDQIRQVIRHIIYTKQFITTWGTCETTYFSQAISFIRALNFNLSFHPEDKNTRTFLLYFRLAEQGLFGGHLVGYIPPDTIQPLIRWLLAECNESGFAELLQQNPAGTRTAEEIVRYWSHRILGLSLPAEILHTLAQTLAQNNTTHTPLSRDPLTWQGRQTLWQLRLVLACITQHPSFYQN